jgi:CO dehydrogenase maturation factor
MVKKQGYTIAMAGKGGTGKTTLAGLLVRFLKEHEMTPILAVDADANTNLNEVLGLEVEETLGEAREMMKKDVPVGMTKDIFMEMKVEQTLVESNGFDLMPMGRPEGGMEHFSRLTTKDIDLLLIVSDSSRRGILSARRIYDLVDELGIRVGRKYLLVNQYRDKLESLVAKETQIFDPDSVSTIPEDDLIYQFDLEGKPTIELPAESVALQAINEVFRKLLLEKAA